MVRNGALAALVGRLPRRDEVGPRCAGARFDGSRYLPPSKLKVVETKFVVFLMLINVVWFFFQDFCSKGHFQTFKDCGVTLQLSF